VVKFLEKKKLFGEENGRSKTKIGGEGGEGGRSRGGPTPWVGLIALIQLHVWKRGGVKENPQKTERGGD